MENKPDDTTWYKSLYKRIRPYQFNWNGKTEDGVSRWIGAPKGPSERICKYMLRYGLAMGLVGLVTAAALVMRVEGSAPLGLLALIGGVHGLIFCIMGLWLKRMSRSLARLKTARELADEFGSSPETVQRLAESHGIRPRININGDNLYDPDELIASRSLLRASSSPDTMATLLRAAHSHAPQTGADSLLRPTELEAVGLTPVQQLFYAPDEESEAAAEPVPLRRQ